VLSQWEKNSGEGKGGIYKGVMIYKYINLGEKRGRKNLVERRVGWLVAEGWLVGELAEVVVDYEL